MPVSLDLISTLIGFGLVVVAGARLGAGSHLSLGGLFPAQGRSDWPQGVQEADAPRFAVEHVAAARPAPPPGLPSIRELPDHDTAPAVEPIKPHVRRFAPHR